MQKMMNLESFQEYLIDAAKAQNTEEFKHYIDEYYPKYPDVFLVL